MGEKEDTSDKQVTTKSTAVVNIPSFIILNAISTTPTP